MRPRITFRSAAAPLALGLALVASCCESEPTGVPVRTVMYELQYWKNSIEPNLRNSDEIDAMTEAGREILALSEVPSFAGYAAAQGLASRREQHDAYLADLRRAASVFVEASEGGDLDAMHSAFGTLNGTCIACHKRFNPAY